VRVISVTRRYIAFLFPIEKGLGMYAPTELPLDTELQLPPTDDDKVGGDVE
jgi:hypothetical protein